MAQAKPIDSGRTTRTYTQQIEAEPDRVFPLLCPAREADWLDGWIDSSEMIHSDTGVAEEGCVFRTRMPAPLDPRAETLWVITRHDPRRRIIEFARFTTGLVVTRLRIRVEAGANASSVVHIAYTFTPVSAAGAAFVREHHSEEAFRSDMAWWEASMDHWLRTGDILRSARGEEPRSVGAS